jgi:hypothetical protein
MPRTPGPRKCKLRLVLLRRSRSVTGKPEIEAFTSASSLWPAAGSVVGVGEFEQFDGRAVFDNEHDADAVRRAVRRNQNFAANKLERDISHFKRDAWNMPDKIGDLRAGSKRIHSTPNSLFSWLTTKTFKCFKWVSPGFASVVGIPM